MSFLGNLLWIFLAGGIFIAFWYVIGGLILCLTIVGIPFGIQCWKLAVLGIAPFGRDVVESNPPSGFLSFLLNVLWIFTAGLGLTITHLVFAILCAATIIGIPFAIQHAKLAVLAFTPFGKVIQ